MTIMAYIAFAVFVIFGTLLVFYLIADKNGNETKGPMGTKEAMSGEASGSWTNFIIAFVMLMVLVMALKSAR